jgi:mono/diheme cytochrome c family protein
MAPNAASPMFTDTSLKRFWRDEAVMHSLPSKRIKFLERSRLHALFCGGVLAWSAGDALSASGEKVDFVRDIQPIFQQACLKCHGPETQKSSYRLDAKSIALTGGDYHAPNIIPGKSSESPLIRFLSGQDEKLKMPPKGERLTEQQIALLKAWVDQGAVWPESASVKLENKLDWWSLKPLVKPAAPKVQGSKFKVQNPIDAFIVAKLQQKGLPQSPEADRRTLIRRLYFDLIGLPPRPEEIQAFIADKDPQAYEKLVDRLLASPQYGERWARHWLDVVHYGDTHGYDKDKPRPNAWPYRDYVIRAFNEDKPYARFVQEQIAGDIMYPGTRDGIEALGFIAAGPWDFIGHAEVPESKTDGKIARHLDRDDMVANTMQTFNSLTVGCAQCHNHKFDPISQEDYYSLQAVFAALDRTDKKYFADADLTKRFNELENKQRTLTARKQTIDRKIKELGGKELATLEEQIVAASKKGDGNTRSEFGYHSAIAKDQNTVKWVQVDLGKSVVIDKVVLQPCYDDFNGIGAGFGFPVRFKIEVSEDAEFKSGRVIIAAKDKEDGRNPGTTPQTFASSGATGRYLRVTATKLALRKNDYIFALAELQVFDSTGHNLAAHAPVTSLDSIEAPPRWRKANLVDAIAPQPDPATSGRLAELQAERAALLDKLLDASLKHERTQVHQELNRTKVELAAFPKPDVVYAGTVLHGSGNFVGTGASGGKPRPIHLLNRGSVLTPGKEVLPGALQAITWLPGRFEKAAREPEGERRAELAKWLTDEQNPLTWRSIVNRVWQYHFGKGLAETPNDFGRMGVQPTHPELIDWLAVEFRDGGQSFKKLHKLMVTSATYRQVSGFEFGASSSRQAISTQKQKLETANQIDADNRYLWRMNRRKLDAEGVRDSVLFVSGKLNPKMGGPAFQDFVIEKPEHSPHYQYHLHDPEDPASHRRSIYRFIVRSQMQPFMTTLDCADPSMQVGKRNESLSPLQALALLNNGLMVTMAKHFAAKLEAGGGDVMAQIERGFYDATGRKPAKDETQKLVAYAKEFGMTNTCRVILNLNEFNFVD